MGCRNFWLHAKRDQPYPCSEAMLCVLRGSLVPPQCCWWWEAGGLWGRSLRVNPTGARGKA